jgi:hypothetical protein
MIEINGKKYEINLDIKLGTQKLMQKIRNDPNDAKNVDYMASILKDILIPSPSTKEIDNFRSSDLETVFDSFGDELINLDREVKKKLR